ncbi:TPA: hypothetical protein ACH3X2_006411 [Trebouxia sp. C0005]
MAPVSALAPLLKHATTLVEGAIVKAADESIIDDVQQLKSVAFAITSAGRHNRDLSIEERTAVWDVNACVDAANAPYNAATKEAFLQMRQIASDLISLAKDDTASDEERLCKCQFFHKTGKLWSQLKDYETAESLYARAMGYTQFLLEVCNNLDKSQATREECALELFGLYLDRTAAAWQLQQKALASNLLGRAKDLASNEDLSSDVSFQLSLALASEQIKRAEQLLSLPEAEWNADAGEAVGLLNTANEVIANLSAEENDPATESKAAAANQMQAQVYNLLAWAYLEAGDKASLAMNCIHSVRRLPAEFSNQPVISFLAMKALCQLAKLREAETELLNLVSSTNVSLSMCLGSIKFMLTSAAAQTQTDFKDGSQTGLAGVKSAVSLIQERFGEQPEVPVQLVRLMLSQEVVTAEVERMALEICAAETTVELLTKEEQSTRKQQLFNLLYSHATNHFQQRVYDSASRFFSAAYMYSEEGNKAKTARVLAVCNLGIKALDRALEYVDIAAQTEPTSVFNAFLRLKVYLLQKDRRAAANQVQAMMKCEDFTHEILRVAAQEAMGAEQTVVAKQALLQLWDMVDTDSNGTFQPGDQAVIMSNLVKITQDNQSGNGELRYLPPARQSGRKGLLACKLTACRADVSSYMDGLSAIYKQGADRLQEIGYDGFFGADTNGRAAALEWLAATAWNAAIQGGEAKLYRDTAVLLCSAGKFYAAHPMPETSTIQYQMMAFLMSASASLEGATKENEDIEVEVCYGLTQNMLLRYKGAAQALADRRQSLAEPPSKAEDKQHVYKLLMEFQLAVHMKDVGCQHAVLQHCREAPNFSAESMLKLAYFSKAALNSNPDVTRLALQAALQLLLSKGHAVPHDQVAQVNMHDTFSNQLRGVIHKMCS